MYSIHRPKLVQIRHRIKNIKELIIEITYELTLGLSTHTTAISDPSSLFYRLLFTAMLRIIRDTSEHLIHIFVSKRIEKRAFPLKFSCFIVTLHPQIEYKDESRN